MGKILLTTLGGVRQNYIPADYILEGKVYSGRKFILSALEEHHKFEKIFVIGTVSSMWDAFYEYICDTYGENYNDDIKTTLYAQADDLKSGDKLDSIDLSDLRAILPEKFELILTKFGINEGELFENLETLIGITDNFSKDDEIYLDLTHGFRSNAFYMFMIMNYVTDVMDGKDQIKGIYYGMLDSGIKPTPILDLKIFSELSKWIKGAHEIKNHGSFYSAANLLSEKKIEDNLIDFSNSLNINYLGEVKKSLSTIEKIQNDLEQGKNNLAKLIIPKVLREFTERFSKIKEEHLFMLEISKWYSDQNKYALSYITLQESMVNCLCKNCYGKVERENIENIKGRLAKLISNYNRKSKIERMSTFAGRTIEFLDIYEKCRQIRNNIAHTGKEKIFSKKDIEELPKYHGKIRSFIKDSEFVDRIIKEL